MEPNTATTENQPGESAQKSQDPSGRLILELRDGRLTLCPVTNSDEETRRLLEAMAVRVRCGDLAELVAA